MLKLVLILGLALASSVETEAEPQQSPFLSLYTGSSLKSFIQGLIIGLQKDVTHPTPCVQSYTSIRVSFDATITSFDNFNVNSIFNFLNNFNNFVNQFVASYDICNYAGIIQQYFTNGTTALLNFLINFFQHSADVISAFKNMFTDLEAGDPFNGGFYFGQLVTLCTGISL
jgi:hypothetical protein